MRVKNVRSRAAEKLRAASRRDGAVLSAPRRSHSSFRSLRSHAPRLTFAQVSALLAASAIVGSSLSAVPAHAQTWIGATGTWSTAANWLNGTVPVSPASLLTFTQNTATGYTATNDIAAPFLFNAMNFAGFGTGAITIASSTGNSLSTTGANPTITQNGLSAATITSALVLAPSSGTTTIGGSGVGALALSGIVSGTGGLAINQSGLFANAGGYPTGGSVVTLSGANTFTGNVTLTRGNLSLASALALGDAANTLTIANGANSTLRVGATIANNINVTTGPLTLASTATGTLSGTITSAGGLTSYGAVNTTLTGASALAGPILLTGGTIASATTGGITLGGATVIGAGATLNVVKNATLILDNATVFNADRIADSVALNLNNGRFQYNTGGTATATSETIGAVNATGFNTISLGTGTANGVNATLNFGTLTRTDNAQLYFRGALNAATSTTSDSVFFAGGLPTITTPGSSGTGVFTPVVPFSTYNTSQTSTFPAGLITYDTVTGVRGLAATNATYFNQVASSGVLLADANNTLTGGTVAITGANRINSLVVNSATTLSGTGTLQVFSGAVNTNFGLTISGLTLDFGANTGYFLQGDFVTLTGASQITGSGGVVTGALFPNYFLVFNNTVANPFTGGLFLNGNGGVQFNTGDSQLGTTGGAIRLNGGTLAYTGTTVAATIGATRPINVGAAGGAIASTSTTAGVVLTVPNNLTGSGDLVKSGSGTVALTGNNSALTGNTIVSTGTLQFGATGLTGGGLVLNGGTLVPLATNTAANAVTVTATSTVTPGTGVVQTLSGGVSGTSALTKTGAGTLVLTGGGGFAGALSVTGGTATLSGAGAIKSPTITVTNAGSELRLDNTATANADRVADGGTVTLSGGGQIRLIGNASTAITENLGVLSLTGSGNIVTVDATGGAATTLSFTGFVPGTGGVLFRGNSIGTPTAARILLGGQANGFVNGATVDDTVTGGGVEQAFYDLTNGVRRANAGDFTTGPTIQNAAPTNTATTANFRVATTTSTAGSANTVNSLRLAPGATLNASSGTLTVTSGGISTEAGTPGASITGGTLASGTGNAFSFAVNADLAVSSALSGASGLVKNGLGALSLTSGSYGVTGALSVNQGSLTTNGTAVTATAVSLGGTALATGDLTATTVNVTAGALSASSLNATGALTMTGGSLTTTGTATIASGNVAGATVTASGLTTGALTVGAGGVVNAPVTFTGNTGLVTTGNGTVNGALTFNATTTATTILNVENTTLSGPVNLPTGVTGATPYVALTTSTTAATPITATISGKISGGSATAGSFVRFTGNGNDSGTWRLTNTANDFIGAVQIYEGAVAITGDGALGNVDNDVTIDIINQTAGGLRFDAPNIVLNPLRTITPTNSGAIDTNGNNAEIQGAFTGSSALTKLGTGTLNLSGATGNTYTGTFTSGAGTLAVNGVFTSPFVAAGGTIGGTGSTGALTVSANGMIAPGNSIGALNATSLVFNGGGALTIELGANGVSDVLNLSGVLTQGTAGTYSLNFLNAGGLANGNTYNFLNFASTTFSVGAGGPSSPFSLTLPSGFAGVVTSNGAGLQLTVNSVAVPEPGSIVLLLGPGALGVFAVARNRRRTKKAA